MYFAPSVTAACCAKLPFNTATLKNWQKTNRFFIVDNKTVFCALYQLSFLQNCTTLSV